MGKQSSLVKFIVRRVEKKDVKKTAVPLSDG